MSTALHRRRPLPFEAAQPYLAFAAYPIAWLLPYGVWTWLIVFAPYVAMEALRRAWGRRTHQVLTPRRTADGVELVDAAGAIVDGFASADVEGVTVVIDRTGAPSELRVDRRRGGALLFAVVNEAEAAEAARALGFDRATARSRYRGAPLAYRFFIFGLIGLGLVGWSAFGAPSPSARAFIAAYTWAVTVPYALLMGVPTWIDVKREGVAWRWLFVRRRVAAADLRAVETVPPGRDDARAAIVQLVVLGGKRYTLPLGPSTRRALGELRALLVASPSAKHEAEPPKLEAWLPRQADEDALAFVQRLRAVARGEGAHPSAPRQQLWAIAEDPAAPAPLRAGALLVVCSTDAARVRVRRLASTTSDPAMVRLIEALARAAGDDELAVAADAITTDAVAADRVA